MGGFPRHLRLADLLLFAGPPAIKPEFLANDHTFGSKLGALAPVIPFAAQAIKSSSVDVVNAIELFEHVYPINEGLRECARVLKKGGLLIIGVPFLYPIHADPFDFQRWTKDKWEREMKACGFRTERYAVSGYFFNVLADMLKAGIKAVPGWLKVPFYIFLPLVDFIALLDKMRFVREHPILSRYHGGYFMVMRKE